jgi:hypothetical protein
MNIFNKTIQVLFWLSVIFIAVSIFVLTIGQALPIEFKDYKIKNNYYSLTYIALPISIFFSLFVTIKKKYNKSKNPLIIALTLLAFGLCFFFFMLIGLTSSIGFSVWTDKAILFNYKSDSTITINQQILDVGIFDYGGERIVKQTSLLHYFYTVKEIDTLTLDKSKWEFVNKKVHY